MKKFIVMILFGIAFIILLLSYSGSITKKDIPVADGGKIDLRSWDSKKDGTILILGEWEFYKDRLLTPEDFDKSSDQLLQITEYKKITTNSIRNLKDITNKKNSIGTYRMLLEVSPDNQYIGLKINNKRLNYSQNRIYVNGKKLDFDHYLYISNEKQVSNNMENVVFFPNNADRIEIILQVTNMDSLYSLTTYQMVLGSQEEVHMQEVLTFGVELCGAALCFLISLYYFYLYFAGKKDKGILFSALEFTGFSVMALFAGERFLYQLFPRVPYELLVKIRNIAFIIVPYSIAGFAHITNNKVVSLKMFKMLRNCILVILAIIIFTPNRIHVYLTHLTFIATTLLYISIIIRSLSLYYRKIIRTNMFHNILYMICLACVGVNFFNYTLYNWGLAKSKFFGQIAMVLFIILSQLFLAIRFNANYKKLLDMEKIKEEFFIKSSYVLNAPLNSISNLSSSIIEKIDNNESNRGYILSQAQMTKNVANGLIDIVNVTLDVTLLQNNQLTLSNTLIDMKICIGFVIKSMEAMIDINKIQINLDVCEALIVRADEGRVRQIIQNLIANSIYSMTQGTIVIKGEKKGGSVFITIEDNGCGIAKELHLEIFHPYVSYRSEGIGLGLYISKQLAEHMEGELYLRWSIPGKGSFFVLELPCYEEKDRGQLEINGSQTEQFHYTIPSIKYNVTNEVHLKTILIVDDELFNIQTAIDILEIDDYNIISAYSGVDALELLETEQVDLVILDVMMPGSSGITTCRRIREKYSIIDLPILLSTSVNVNNDLDIGLLAQANDVISKPFMKKELSARVKTLIALKTSIEDAAKSELAFLQAQIKPHFVYNAINTIVSFCYTDSEKAARLLTDFGRYLRLTFDVDNVNMQVSVRKEIELVKVYTEIQNARFGDRFEIAYDIQQNVLDKKIPSLIIQPLVENSIKHGFYQMEGKGYIFVTVGMSGDRLIIIVKDTGIGMSIEELELLYNLEGKNGSVGLLNIQRRIRKIKEATMDIQSERNVGSIATISLKM